MLLVALVAALQAAAPADAQIARATDGQSLAGWVLPVEPRNGPITINALRGAVWKIGDTQRLVVDGDVSMSIAGFEFETEEAVIWINRIPSAGGLINQIAVYLPEARGTGQAAGQGVRGSDLLVTGSTRGGVTLDVALLDEGRPSRNARLLDRAETRLKDYLAALATTPAILQQIPQVTGAAETPQFVPEPGAETPIVEPLLPQPVGTNQRARPWLQQPGGSISFSADSVVLEASEGDRILTARGDLVVQYLAPGSDTLQDLQLTAQNGVLFLEPGTTADMTSRNFTADQVLGVYLEGNVVAEADAGRYVVRAPRVYYDFVTGEAIMLDAVMRTYSRDSMGHVYARAEEMRQVSADQWSAEGVRVSRSAFAVPHLALGAERVTLTQRPRAGGDGEEMYIESDTNTVRMGGTPVAWWPSYKGTLEKIPISSVSLGWGTYEGGIIETAWDLFSLLGIAPTDELEAELHLDGYTKRGVGFGLDGTFDMGLGRGAYDLYLLNDSGEERTSAGRTLDVEDTWRGLALLEHQLDLGADWDLQTQLSYISDDTFISSWRTDDFRDRREYETSIYLKHQKRNAAFTVLGKVAANDFISNDYLLGSLQYQVQKAPEFTYQRFGDPLFDSALVWSGDVRMSRMKMVFQEGTPNDIGVSRNAFLLPDGSSIKGDDPISDVLTAQGLRSTWVNRLSTRHELALPFDWGDVHFTPFVAAQGMYYFSGDDGTISSDDSSTRLYGSVGMRMGTQFQYVMDDVESSALDLHRLRHVFEPSMTVWYGDSDYDLGTAPQYDGIVDQLSEGTALRVDFGNRWQTYRGGPGRWYAVDWLKLDVGVVFASNDSTNRYGTPQWFDFRPEYSQLGNFIDGELNWMVSDSLSVYGMGTLDFDDSDVNRGSIGIEMSHSPRLRTYVEYRYIALGESELLELGWSYEMSKKYDIRIVPQWDFREGSLRSVRFNTTRSFPDFDVEVFIGYDDIRGETLIGASIDPVTF